jgi:uncharacterized LabA/DUF88 family protein
VGGSSGRGSTPPAGFFPYSIDALHCERSRGKGKVIIQNVIAYIDGFNLYHGLRDKHGRRFLWLNLEKMCHELLASDQRLVAVKYFTAPVRRDAPALQRQQAFWNALKAATGVEVVRGRFQEKTVQCRQCRSSWITYEEKETDVSIAVALVEDAALRRFDTALVVSADSDLCPAVRAVKRVAPAARVVAAFPPKRDSGDLRRVVHAYLTIGDGVLRRSLLPDLITTSTGVTIKRPPSWR